WSEANPYARLVRTVYLLKTTPDDGSEFYRVDLANRTLEPATLPSELENVRDLRRGLFNYSAGEAMMLVLPIFRPGRQFGGLRPEEFRRGRPDEFRWRGDRPDRSLGPENRPRPDRGELVERGPGPARGPGGGPGPGPIEGAVTIEVDRDIVLN